MNMKVWFGFGRGFLLCALPLFGAARTLYANVLGKGHEVHFSTDTSIQLQLAPSQASQP